MGVGIKFEHLMQIVFVIEGLALWKVPTPSAKAVIEKDFGLILEKIISDKNSTTEKRIENATALSKTKYWYDRLHCVAGVFCSFYPLIFLTFILFIVSLIWNISDQNFWITSVAAGYLLLKLIIVVTTRYFANKFDKQFNVFVPVESPTEKIELESLSSK